MRTEHATPLQCPCSDAVPCGDAVHIQSSNKSWRKHQFRISTVLYSAPRVPHPIPCSSPLIGSASPSMCNVQCARWHAVFRIPYLVSRIPYPIPPCSMLIVSAFHSLSLGTIHLLVLTCTQQYQFGNQRGAFHRHQKRVERGAFDRGCMRRHQTIPTQRPGISLSVNVGRLSGMWETQRLC